MLNIINLAISLVVSLLNIVIYLFYNSKFVVKYKEYRINVNESLIKKYKGKILGIFKKTKESPEIEDKINEMIEEFSKENVSLSLYEKINGYVKWTFIILGISIMSTLLYLRFTDKIATSTWTFYDLGFFSMVIGVLLFLFSTYKIFSLNRFISNFELGIEEKKE